MSEVFRAIEPFSTAQRNGVSRTIRAGDLVSSEDPDFKGREHLFEPAINAANRALETASAAPGERRHRGRPAGLPEKQPDDPKTDEPKGE